MNVDGCRPSRDSQVSEIHWHNVSVRDGGQRPASRHGFDCGPQPVVGHGTVPWNRLRPMEPLASRGTAHPNHSHSAEPITPKKREPGGGCRRAREERREEGVQLWGSAGNLASGGVPLTASIQPPHAWRILRMSLKRTRKNHRSCTTTAARARHERDSDHMIARLRHDADRGASWTRGRRECRHNRSAPGRRFDAPSPDRSGPRAHHLHYL